MIPGIFQDLLIPQSSVPRSMAILGTGDIKVFENTNGLEYFDLASTKVTGDIQVLNTTGQLKVVHLPNTRVHGDIAVFSSTDP